MERGIGRNEEVDSCPNGGVFYQEAGMTVYWTGISEDELAKCRKKPLEVRTIGGHLYAKWEYNPSDTQEALLSAGNQSGRREILPAESSLEKEVSSEEGDVLSGFIYKKQPAIDWFRRLSQRSGEHFWQTDPIMGAYWIMAHPRGIRVDTTTSQIVAWEYPVPKGIDLFDSLQSLHGLVRRYPVLMENFPHLKDIFTTVPFKN